MKAPSNATTSNISVQRIQERAKKIHHNTISIGCESVYHLRCQLKCCNFVELGKRFRNCLFYFTFLCVNSSLPSQQQWRRYLGVCLNQWPNYENYHFRLFFFKIFERHELMTSLYTVNYLYSRWIVVARVNFSVQAMQFYLSNNYGANLI